MLSVCRVTIPPTAAPKVHDTVINLLKEEGKLGKVLEAGAGSGALAKKLIEMGFELCAVDKFPEQFEVKGVSCKKADLNETLPYSNSSFDFITCVETIEHLWNPGRCIKEFYRVLKPDGVLILTTPNVLSIFSRILFVVTGRLVFFQDDDLKRGHVIPMPLWTLELLLTEMGFIVEKYAFNRGWVPFIRIEVPLKNLFLGQILIVKARKKAVKSP